MSPRGYYQAAGAIRGPETARILLDHLTHAPRFLAEGRQSADENQLRAFALQVQGFAPQRVTQGAANALAGEAELLRLIGP